MRSRRSFGILAGAALLAACKPAGDASSRTTVDIPSANAAPDSSAAKARPCMSTVTDMWGASGRPDSSMSTSARFDGAGHVVFAVEKRKLTDSVPVITTSTFVWTPAGELASIDSSTVRAGNETKEHTEFKYGSHHELVESSLESPQREGGDTTRLAWSGTFAEARARVTPGVPSLTLPGYYRDLPNSLLARSTFDPMPSLSFTGDVTITSHSQHSNEVRIDTYKDGLETRTESLGAARPRIDYTYDAAGHLESSEEQAGARTTYTWDKDRLVRERIETAEYDDTAISEYDRDGRLARQRLVDRDGKPIADTTWSDACPPG